MEKPDKSFILVATQAAVSLVCLIKALMAVRLIAGSIATTPEIIKLHRITLCIAVMPVARTSGAKIPLSYSLTLVLSTTSMSLEGHGYPSQRSFAC